MRSFSWKIWPGKEDRTKSDQYESFIRKDLPQATAIVMFNNKSDGKIAGERKRNLEQSKQIRPNASKVLLCRNFM